MPKVTIDTNVDINASRAAVWEVLTDFPSYSEWSPFRNRGDPRGGPEARCAHVRRWWAWHELQT